MQGGVSVNSIGCGRFDEAQWMEHLFGHEPTGKTDAHRNECPLCHDEITQMQRMVGLVRQVPVTEPAVQDVFVTSVMDARARSLKEQATQPSRRRIHGMLRPLPLYGSAVALTAALSITFLVWMSGNQSQFDISKPSAPLISSSVSMLIESDPDQRSGLLTAHGVTHAHQTTESTGYIPSAEPLRMTSGSTSGTFASF